MSITDYTENTFNGRIFILFLTRFYYGNSKFLGVFFVCSWSIK